MSQIMSQNVIQGVTVDNVTYYIDYNYLVNKPTIPSIPVTDTSLSSQSTNPVCNNVIKAALDDKASIVSPTLSGIPTAPTPSETTNSTQIATTAFVQNKITTLENALENISQEFSDTIQELSLRITSLEDNVSDAIQELSSRITVLERNGTAFEEEGMPLASVDSDDYLSLTGSTVSVSNDYLEITSDDVNVSNDYLQL